LYSLVNDIHVSYRTCDLTILELAGHVDVAFVSRFATFVSNFG